MVAPSSRGLVGGACLLMVLLSLSSLSPASAQPIDDGSSDASSRHAPIVNRVNLRIGFDSSNDDGRATVCADINIALGFGIEACGTGNQVWHNDSGEELSHYRVNYSFAERSLWEGTLHVRGGLGFAEMQVGKDSPGFVFGGTGADRASTSGPEGALSAQWLLPMYKGFDFVVTATGGLAYFAHAGELATTKSSVQSFVSIEAGVGW